MMPENSCQCSCGALDFELRINRGEQVGLLTCAAGHHSLLLDSRDFWADVLQDGRPKVSRCRCGGKLFRVKLEYEFRESGDVRTIEVKPTCSNCGRPQLSVVIDIKYSPTNKLLSEPLDPIQDPWLQPKRNQITAFWQPSDAEKFASHLVQTLGARVFSIRQPLEFAETDLADIDFHPELKQDLLFTNIKEIVPMEREPQKAGPFLRLDRPTHMMLYSEANTNRFMGNPRLLHYVKYSDEIVQGGVIEKQPAAFREFARQVREWLSQNYLSIRGRNTADNPNEYAQIKNNPKERH